MTILNEWANVLLPHVGSSGMRQIAALRVHGTPTAIDLRTLFAGSKIGSGFPYFLSIKADMAPQPTGYSWGGKFMFAMAANAASGISQSLTGSVPGVCYPLSDGEEIRGRVLSQRETWSAPSGFSGSGGYATMVNYTHIHFLSSAGGGSSGFSPSGFLRIYGSSVVEGQAKNNFPAP